MKKNLLLYAVTIIMMVLHVSAQRPFITTWNTTNQGVSGNNKIYLNATGSNFSVSWVNTANAADTGHATMSGQDTLAFAAQGIYKVYITPGSGTFSAIRLRGVYNVNTGYYGDNLKLLSIEQWGDINWTSFYNAFFYCANMVLNAVDTPHLTAVTNMSNMFNDCTSLTTNAAMSNWNVSSVTDMSDMFFGDDSFNQSISNWNVGNVTNMSDMFQEAHAYNQPVASWNVSHVTDMHSMFSGADAFNQPLDSWNVSNVNNMQGMFDGAIVFNQPLSNWNVSNVTNMEAMFAYTYNFKQPIGGWDVSNVNNMQAMFDGNYTFNQPVASWNVSNVTDMSEMFYRDSAFNQPITGWNVGNVNTMNNMFANATSFNQPIGNWNVGNVTDMTSMFANATSFNQPVGNWNVSNVSEMGQIFYIARSFNQPIGKWNLSAAPEMFNMLDSSGIDCSNYSKTLRGWADSASTPNILSLSAANLTFDSVYAKAAHDRLTNTKGWIITGDKIGQCTVVLPVNLTTFTAVHKSNSALLNWSVANEINDKGYYIQKSVDGVTFTTIAFVAAHNSVQQTTYTYTDNSPLSYTDYYRLKQVDIDGRITMSVVRKIQLQEFAWHITANPIHNSSVEIMLNKMANISIEVVSAAGSNIKVISKGKVSPGTYSVPLQIDNLGSGVYFIRLKVDDKIYSAAVVKQ